jgi:YesN/AraC family two-component response regulator
MKLTGPIQEPGKKSEVLIIEDSPEVVHFMKQLLSDLYSVTIAGDGKTALDLIESQDNNADIIVLDYRLPDISGLEVLRKIKRIKPHIPVLFITAYGDEEVAVKAFRYGVKNYLKKPFNYNEFLKMLEFSLSLARIDKRKPREVFIDDVDRIKSDTLDLNDPAIRYNLQKAVIFISNNFMNKITLNNVAKEACMSRYHFSREFKKTLGCTYKDYLNNLRIEKARELLKNSRLSITEAAFSVGYSDLTNFERVFKRIVGCTPKEFKNRPDQ